MLPANLAGQIGIGGTREPTLLPAVHRTRRVVECRAAAKSDLHEYEALAVPHDKIDFAVSDAEIAREKGEAGLAKPRQRVVFCVSA